MTYGNSCCLVRNLDYCDVWLSYDTYFYYLAIFNFEGRFNKYAMNIIHRLLYTLLTVLLISSCELKHDLKTGKQEENWEEQLLSQIKLLGHRNWIVVADAAYPLQSNPGIKTIFSDKNQIQTLQIVNDIINRQTHIKPTIYLDKEIDFVSEEDAKGITLYRASIDEMLSDNAQKVLHEEIITLLDKASELFNVIIIKTDFTIPYTSVFIQLDCKYWDAESELELRKKISQAGI